ncbi:SGNH/GDSL hydrolase family protein [Granulicella sp. 5B5]|uniref:SGNH/GDSL hydrolase family protein n=1 Tax=Granulicella sp. 5B5 TaxID=1617967 RepID=UPI002106D607|nr:SGNH/GDSL hydrolase family protein [Granulicella sp. 5B5]
MSNWWQGCGRVARRLGVVSAGIALSMALGGAARAQSYTDGYWVGTWGTAPMAYENSIDSYGGMQGVTLREIAHVSVGGSAVRVTLSNEFGKEPLTVNAAAIAVRQNGSEIAPGTSVPLLFGGRAAVVIPPGALVVSDAAALAVKPLSDVAVSLYVPSQPMTVISRHGFANQTNYEVSGNAVAAPELVGAKTFVSWDFLKDIAVKSDAEGGAVVAFGDSITDGAHSTRDANTRWPDVLAARLLGDRKTAKTGVINEGIGGNRVLHDGTGPSALERFDRDVIAQPGVKYVIVMESINDIGHAADPDPAHRYDIVTADDLIFGLTQLAERAHMHGIKVIGATLTPYVGAKYQSAEGETMRQTVNHWIRTSKEFDGVVDFDKVTTDPARAGVYLPADDSGDHLHPGDAGYKAMGDSIDLKLFAK